jgi:hypothetical protein
MLRNYWKVYYCIYCTASTAT